MRRVAGLALSGAAMVLCTVGTAHAADPTGRIDYVEAEEGKVQVLFSVPGLGADASPDLSTIHVTINDEPVEAVAEPVEEADVRRTAVLALDVSLSMNKDNRWPAAKAAARTYIEQAPEDLYIGLVTYASDVRTVEQPTRDRDALLSELDSLKLSLHTRVFDGILEALRTTGNEGERTVIVLSDGEDTSGTPLNEVLAAAELDDVRIDVVALDQALTPESALAQIAAVTEGSVFPASTADIEAQFAREASELAKQMAVTFDLPSDATLQEGTLRVSVEAGGSTFGDEAFVSFDGSDAPSPSAGPADSGSSVTISRPMMLGGIALVFVGLALLLGFGLPRIVPEPETAAQRQLAMYTIHGMRRAAKQQEQDQGPGVRDSAVALANKLMVRKDFEALIAKKLEAGDVKLKAAEWLLAHIGFAILAAMFGFLFKGGLIATLVFLLVGLVLPWVFLSFKAARRVKKFNEQLAPTLQILAGGLSAGLSLPQAVNTVVEEGSQPMADEFRHALIEARLGVEVEDTLEHIADRMDSVDFRWVVMAIRIQREVGGNLSELLLNVAATLREREYLRRQVKVLSAEGRLSAWILGGLPPAFLGYLALVRPAYLAPMFEEKLGWIMLGFGTVLMIVGAFWMKKSVTVEV